MLKLQFFPWTLDPFLWIPERSSVTSHYFCTELWVDFWWPRSVSSSHNECAPVSYSTEVYTAYERGSQASTHRCCWIYSDVKKMVESAITSDDYFQQGSSTCVFSVQQIVLFVLSDKLSRWSESQRECRWKLKRLLFWLILVWCFDCVHVYVIVWKHQYIINISLVSIIPLSVSWDLNNMDNFHRHSRWLYSVVEYR